MNRHSKIFELFLRAIRFMYTRFLLLRKKKNIILIESVPSLSDSPRSLFDEMISRGLNEKYHIVWWLYDDTIELPSIKNVEYLPANSGPLKIRYYECMSKCLISCNRALKSRDKNQKSFYILHGTIAKNLKNYYNLPKDVDYFLCASDEFLEVSSEQLKIDANKGVGLGFPRNDALGKKEKDITSFFNGSYNKIIVWYPTFRQHKDGLKTASSHAFPIIHDSAMAKELNDFAKEIGVLLVIKPHFVQDLSNFHDLNLSNIVFVSDKFYMDHNILSYEFLNSCDALITDYSSVYFDYLLCNKPVGLIWEDVDEYRVNPGFCVDIDYYFKGGEKIYNLAELKEFVYNVYSGKDRLFEERNDINKIVNCSNDGQSTKRVLDFIIEKANL